MLRSIKISLLSSVLFAFLAGSAGAQLCPVGDLDGNCRVDWQDLLTFAEQWLDPPGGSADLLGDDGVNMSDFALLAENWLVEGACLIISEFMASNGSTLLDEDGDSSDWLEIYNPTDAAINLDGWYLTDDADELTKWQFPAVTLDAGEFLVVFASGKDRTNDPNKLHTNFKLDKDGEYLALVASDGVTIAYEYAPQYPEQLRDISYGLAQNSTMLVSTGDIASYYVPIDDTWESTWMQTDFNDSQWDTGPTGLGFGSAADANLVGHWKLDGDATDSSGNGNDGTVVGDPEWVTGWIGGALEFDGDGRVDIANESNFDITDEITVACWIKTTVFGSEWQTIIAKPGGQYEGVWRLNRNWNEGGNSVFFTCEGVPPHNAWGTVNVKDGQWHHIAGVYDGAKMYLYVDGEEDVSVDASGSINTSDYAVHISDVGFDGLIDHVHVYDRGLSADEITQLYIYGTVETEMQSQMKGVNGSLWARIEFNVEDPGIFDALLLRLKYEDGFVAYLNGQEIARRNAPNSVQWDSTAASDRPNEDALVFEEINITGFVSELQSGTNVLAIHGLNDDKDDGEFLILPELVTAGNLDVPQYFATATPGTFNIGGALDFVKDVEFSVERGFYDEPFDVTLSTDTNDAEIRYTLDGSEPKIDTGMVYTGPITIGTTACLRAAAFKPDWLDSTVETHTYIFIDDVITQSPNGEVPGPNWPPPPNYNGQDIDYGMDLDVVNDPCYAELIDDALLSIPTISLVTDLDNLFDASIGIYVNAYQDGRGWERPTSMELINPDDSEGFQFNAGLRIRGGFSRGGFNPKHAFRLFFRGEYGEPKLKFPLFGGEGVDEFDNVDLRTSQNYSWSCGGDSRNTMNREVFSRDTQREMGQPYTRSRYYHLYINGHYWGLFQTQERSEASYAESYFGGDKDDYDVLKPEWAGGNRIAATDGNLAAWQRLWEEASAGFDTDEAYYRVQGLNTDGTRNPDYELMVDIDNLIEYMLLIYYGGNLDAPVSWCCGDVAVNNFYMIYNRNEPDGWKFFAHDAEHTLLVGELYRDRTGPFSCGEQFKHFNPQWLHQQLTAHPEYRMRFADRVHEHFFNAGLLSPEGATDSFMARADEIDLAIIAESARWGDAKSSTPLTKNDDWLPTINNIVNNYFPYRTNIVLNQFKTQGWYPDVEAPTFNQHGGQVPSGFNLLMSAPSGTIYYTLDSNDPRLPGGAINPDASIFFEYESSQTTLIQQSAEWKYLDNGSDQGTAWRDFDFNDSQWQSGPAELGYGDGNEATVVSYGPDPDNKYITTYFRRSFDANDVNQFTTLALQLLRDDGAVVYLNGDEVARSNMPGGTVNYLTTASSGVGGGEESTFFEFSLDHNLLNDGNNVLAVEIHQCSSVSSDISFDLELTATKISTQTPITLTETTNVKARVLDGDEWSALNEATFIIEPLALFINEFMADNETTIEDPNEPGEFPDWLELYNAGTAAGNFIVARK